MKKFPMTGRMEIAKPPLVSPSSGFAIIHAPEPQKREAVAKLLLKRRSIEKIEK